MRFLLRSRLFLLFFFVVVFFFFVSRLRLIYVMLPPCGAKYIRLSLSETTDLKKSHQVTDFVVVYQSLFFIIWSNALYTYVYIHITIYRTIITITTAYYSYTVFEIMFKKPTHYISLHRFVPPVDFFQWLDTSRFFLQSLSRLACADGSSCASSCLHSVFGISVFGSATLLQDNCWVPRHVRHVSQPELQSWGSFMNLPTTWSWVKMLLHMSALEYDAWFHSMFISAGHLWFLAILGGWVLSEELLIMVMLYLSGSSVSPSAYFSSWMLLLGPSLGLNMTTQLLSWISSSTSWSRGGAATSGLWSIITVNDLPYS